MAPATATPTQAIAQARAAGEALLLALAQLERSVWEGNPTTAADPARHHWTTHRQAVACARYAVTYAENLEAWLARV